jgi:TRAP-type C4-dicarboxylate transport system permease small subunit
MMPPLAQKIILTLADLVWLIFNSLVIWHGSKFMASMFQFPYISQTTGINLVWVQMIVPLGFALMSLRIVQVMVRRWKTHEPIVVDSRVDD